MKKTINQAISEIGQAQQVFANTDLVSCRFCGAEPKLTWKQGGFAIECVKRFNGCPMNARTHRDPDIHEVIQRWQSKPATCVHGTLLGSPAGCQECIAARRKAIFTPPA